MTEREARDRKNDAPWSAREHRERDEEGGDEATKQLIRDMDDAAGKLAGEVRQSINEATPAPVREAAAALQKI